MFYFRPVFYSIIFLLFSTSPMLFSQDDMYEYYESSDRIHFISANITLVSPLGNFKNNIPTSRYGLELHFLRQFKPDKPLFFGMSAYYTSLGSRRASITELLDNTIIDFNYKTTSNLLGLNGVLRFYPDIKLRNAEFYSELLLGGKWLFTNTTKTIPDTEDTDYQFESGSFAWNYGVAIGTNIPIKGMLYLNLRVCYIPGLSSSYYVVDKKKDIQFSTIEGFTLKNSTTDVLTFDFGVTFAF